MNEWCFSGRIIGGFPDSRVGERGDMGRVHVWTSLQEHPTDQPITDVNICIYVSM